MRKVNDLLGREIRKSECLIDELDASLEESKRRISTDLERRDDLIALVAELKQVQDLTSK